MANVKLEHVRKVYDQSIVAVNNATFEVKDGEFVVLVGPSGCGKSTLLRMIAGLESITSGSIYIDDQYVNDVPPKDRDIAMVFQNYALYPHMTVYENMAFGLKLRKFSKDEINARVRQAAEILGIEGILDRKPKQLSGGQRQRVAVGRAIVRQPRVFLFDEPLSNLDAKLRVQTRTEISKLHRQLKATMIYVTHDQTEAMTMGTRIVVLKDGIIQQIDTPLNLYNHPANKFVAGFIGSPSMNFLEGMIYRDGDVYFKPANGSFSIPMRKVFHRVLEQSSERNVVFGIRPEKIKIARDDEEKSNPAAVKMTLEVVEPMGNEMFVYLSSGTDTIIARISPQELPEPGQSVHVLFDPSGQHLFDAEAGEALPRIEQETMAA